MFSKRGKNEKKLTAPTEPVFQSVHIEAERSGSILLVHVLDEHITEREAGIVYDESTSLIDDRCTAIIVDLSRVTMLASAGIGMLVKLNTRIGERRGTLTVCSLSAELSELFKLTRMDRLFSVKRDREAALASLAS